MTVQEPVGFDHHEPYKPTVYEVLAIERSRPFDPPEHDERESVEEPRA